MSYHEPLTTGTKLCTRCGSTKHVLAFAANRNTSDGLQTCCRDCESIAHRKKPSRAKRRPNVLNRWPTEGQSE